MPESHEPPAGDGKKHPPSAEGEKALAGDDDLSREPDKPLATAPVPIRVVNLVSKARLAGAVVQFQLQKAKAKQEEDIAKESAELKAKVVRTKQRAVADAERAVEAAASDHDRRTAQEALTEAQVEATTAGGEQQAADRAYEQAAAIAAASERVQKTTHHAVADEDGDLPGDFELPHGLWTATALAADHASDQQTIAILAEKRLTLELAHLVDDIDQETGERFQNRLIFALVLLIPVYWFSHVFWPDRTSIGAYLFARSAEAKVALEKSDHAADEAVTVVIREMQKAVQKEESRGELAAALTDAERSIDRLESLLSQPEPADEPGLAVAQDPPDSDRAGSAEEAANGAEAAADLAKEAAGANDPLSARTKLAVARRAIAKTRQARDAAKKALADAQRQQEEAKASAQTATTEFETAQIAVSSLAGAATPAAVSDRPPAGADSKAATAPTEGEGDPPSAAPKPELADEPQHSELEIAEAAVDEKGRLRDAADQKARAAAQQTEAAAAEAARAQAAVERAEAAVADVEPVVAAAVKERAVEDLARLDPIIADIAEEEQLEGPRPQRLFMWSSGAKRLLEILFWATAGILVRLIITIGRYLRLYRFYGNGIPQHRALLFCAPFLTLVYVLLISMVRIDSDAVALDLSNPQILAGISFLLAATPWGLWERLQGVAERVLGENDQAPRKGGK